MAFGIDDALATAVTGINLADTMVQVVKRYRKKKQDVDIELLIEEVRVSALKRIDEADLALVQLERMLLDKKVDLGKSMSDAIAVTPFWKPFEQRRLSQIRKRFNELSDGLYSATDDVAALLRCRDRTGEMGVAIVESAATKHSLHVKLVNAGSIGETIALLRNQLAQHKTALSK